MHKVVLYVDFTFRVKPRVFTGFYSELTSFHLHVAVQMHLGLPATKRFEKPFLFEGGVGKGNKLPFILIRVVFIDTSVPFGYVLHCIRIS